MLLKKLFLILVLIYIFGFSVYSAEEPSVSAHSAVLINADTVEVIYEKNSHDRHSMASTTKIMTALLAIESGRMSELVTAENMAAEGTSIGLKNGYKMELEALVWGMLLESGNDAAKLAANFISGDEEAFSALMNARAEKLGMTDTSFVTASGLDSREHFSSAYDMALLGVAAINNPTFREICSTKTKTVSFVEPDISLTFSNHNKLLWSCDGVFGIKTGFTKKSGRCLVSACERDGVTLLAATLNAPDDWNDHMKLYTYGYSIINTEKLFLRLPEKLSLQSGDKSSITIGPDSDLQIFSYIGEKGNITQKIFLPRFIYAPVNAGQIVGRIEIYRCGALIKTINIVAQEDASGIEYKEKRSLFKRITEKILHLFDIK